VSLIVTSVPSYAQQTFYNINAIQKIEIFFSQSNWKSLLDTLKATTDGYLTADSVRINGTNFPQSNVKFKGNSSYDASFAKNPFTIKLDKNITQDYQGIASIKLSNIYQDPSMIREALGYHVLSHYMHCSRANFAQVYVNGVLQGLFTNVEDVSKTFVASHFKSAKTNTFLKCNPVITPGPSVKSNLKYISADSSAYANYYEIESSYGWTELVQLANTITNNPTLLASAVDIDRLLWMMAFDNVTVNLDSYIGAFSQNYFMFKDNNNIFNPIVWDLNMCFGGLPYIGSSNTSLGALTIAQQKQLATNIHVNDPYWPMITAVMANPTYKRMYAAHIRTIVNEMFAGDYYKTYAATLQSIIDTAVTSDPNKFFTYTDFKNGLTTDISIGSYMAPGINNLMDARVTYLKSTAEVSATTPVLTNMHPNFSNTDSLFTLTLTASGSDSVFLGYRLNLLKKFARVPMYDDGLHGDGAANDGVYGVSVKVVPDESQYYIYAENSNAGIFYPERSEHEYYSITSTTGINEAAAKHTNISVYPNPASGKITIQSGVTGSEQYSIVNVLGDLMTEGTIKQTTTVDLSSWNNGLYFLRVGDSIQKIIVNQN
jgi:hypothetical protein